MMWQNNAWRSFWPIMEVEWSDRALIDLQEIIYTVMGNVVTIITLWNNNKDPKGLFKLLSK